MHSTFLRKEELLKIEELHKLDDLQAIIDIFDEAFKEYQLDTPDCDNCERISPEDCGEYHYERYI